MRLTALRYLAPALGLALFAPPAPAWAAPAPASREVIMLVRQNGAPMPRGETPYSAVEAALNHIGLVVTFHDITFGLPAADLSGRVRGVVSLLEGGDAPDARALAAWFQARLNATQRVVLLGGAACMQQSGSGARVPSEAWSPVLQGLGVTFTGEAFDEGEIPLGWAPGGWPAFEVGQRDRPPLFQPLTLTGAGCQAVVSARRTDTAQVAPLAAVNGQGGFVARQDVALAVNPVTYRLAWRLDPFRFFAQALGTHAQPVFDTTTVNGRRIFYAHIDGDGFANRAIEQRSRLAAEVVRDELLSKTWLPTTVSVIASELAGKPAYEAIARTILRLPHIEGASHSWLHPHDWEKGLLTPQGAVDASETTEMAGKTTTLSPTREVDESLRYVQTLLPPGKRVGLMLWSGLTNPTEPFLVRTRAYGVPNMNGGDARLALGSPSVATLAPVARRVGGHWQVFNSAANENVFTNLWTGPFDGQRHAIDLFERLGAPRRLAPVNIYYHFYAAERQAGLRALKSLYAWAEARPLTPLFASGYARIAEGFLAGELKPDGPNAWLIAHAGACRTLRFDGADGRPDLAASTGVAGFKVTAGSLYIHLAAPDARLVMARGQAAVPHLEEANAPLMGWAQTPRSLSAKFSALTPAQVVLAGFPPRAALRLKGDFTSPFNADAQGRLALNAPAGVRSLEVSW